MINRKSIAIAIMYCVVVLLSACSQSTSSLKVDQVLLEEQEQKERKLQEQEQKEKELEEARNSVINKFRNERNTSGKFIEDMAKKYPEDEVIATIYNYDTAVTCLNFSKMSEYPQEWLDEAKASASKISPTYAGEFSDEIIPWVSKFLGDEWESVRAASIANDEKMSGLTLEDKKEIHKYIESRYDYYNKKDGKDTGDKYSQIIWQEASEKFGLSEYSITSIWNNIDVIAEIGQDNAQVQAQEIQKESIKGDAILDYDGEKSLIAVSEDVMDKFFKALTNGNEGTIQELYSNFKIAQVPVGTPVNIIEKKLTRAKVKILDGVYKDNEVWVLIESLQEN